MVSHKHNSKSYPLLVQLATSQKDLALILDYKLVFNCQENVC